MGAHLDGSETDAALRRVARAAVGQGAGRPVVRRLGAVVVAAAAVAAAVATGQKATGAAAAESVRRRWGGSGRPGRDRDRAPPEPGVSAADRSE